MAETVLVTGGTGYVAGWCIVTLLERGYDVRTTVRGAGREKAVRDAVSTAVDPGDRLTFTTADLRHDDGWDAAMAGADYVLHGASPLGQDDPRNPDDLIVPAREGALRVLRAATRAGVKRVVLTSAANAASPASYTSDGVTDETLWTVDDPALPAYRRSKTLAEQAAWDFMSGYDGPTTLATSCPVRSSARSWPPETGDPSRSSPGCCRGRCRVPRGSGWRPSTSAISPTCTCGR